MTRRRQLDFHWKLRQQMAAHDMWKTTQLAPLLRDRGIDLSAAQIYRLVTDKPERLSMKVLVALCDIFDCTPNDLITPEAVVARGTRAAGDPSTRTVTSLNPDLRPERARITDSDS
ncbi:helix-turn-helix transcriptional regulator [Rhodococcus sp. H29-C3]|uniref:helix-turn-helix domain-containing protein n=1 Tax=Rhodococcus sp. H29-C3 TaxID=3046307 RepID=UPI0024BA19CA|nr:helix-turn-helix transcriptional regulator [Rhodococcus sp. H29-C3]MDJ0363482.1 helix-turn-helix transcriptional regulator [Rhodococcus sp. H29-C3]